MPVTINGTTGVSGADGSAATPAIQGGDTNTGVFFPAADTVAVATGGSERVRVDSSGNVGVGTSSPSHLVHAAGNVNGSVTVASNNTNAGTSAFSRFLALGDAGNAQFGMTSSGYTDITGAQDAMLLNANSASGGIAFALDGVLKAKIDSSGNLLVGTTSFSGGSTVGFQINATNNTSGAYAQLIKNSSNTEIFQMRCNGGLANFSANDVNLSDVRVKTDIQDAGDYLAKICAIPVRTFKYKDQTDDLLNLGCIAQEVEVVAPELVDATGFGETPEDGVPLKAIYQTDLQYALMKCIQELTAKLTAAEARIAALEAK